MLIFSPQVLLQRSHLMLVTKYYVEGCRLTAASDHLANYNSDAYGYKFFKVTGISTTNNTVTYDMTGITTGTFGVYDDGITLGYLVNKKQVPQFEMVLKDDVKLICQKKKLLDLLSVV